LGSNKVTLRSQYSLEEAINKTRLYQDKLFIQPSVGATAQEFNQEVKIITTNHILNNDLSVKLRNGQSITCGYLVYKDNTVNNGDTKSYITSIDNKYSPSRAADYNTEGSFSHQISTRYEFKPDSSRHQIDIGLDYVISKQILRQNLNVVYDNLLEINEQRLIGSVMYNPVQSHFFIPRVDYSYSFSDSLKFEMGLKANILDLNNEIARTNSYIKNGINSDSLNPSNYTYEEKVLAAYFNTDYKWGKMDVNLGLRAENWHANGIQKVNGASLERNQFQLFPSLLLSYQATPSIQLIINYSRRIDRPNYDQLNPSARFIDAYTRSKGNPMLLPSLSNNLEIGTNFLDGLAGFTISAFQANNPILGFSAVADKDTNYKTVLQPQNLQSLNNLNFSTYYSPVITKIWHIDFSGNVFYNKISGQYSGASSTNSAWGYNGNVRQKVTLGKRWELNVNFMYMNRGIWGVLQFKDYYDLSFGIQKTFWAEKCTISLWGRNILNSNYYRAATNTPNLKDSGAYLRDNQLIQLSLTWKLGNLKKEHKEVEKIFNKGNGGGF
jgi:outer membrane receptor protein involved in Fe transport